jgi:hypothetical protein
MATDLQPVAAFADMVGVVDRPGGQPENFFLQDRMVLPETFVAMVFA